MPVSLGKGSNKSRFAQGGAARFVNCYLESQGEDTKVPAIVVASDGLQSFTTVSESGNRAVLEVDGSLYVINGHTLYKVDPDGSSTVLGGIASNGVVYMDRNRRTNPQIGIVADTNFYVYDTGTGSYVHVTGPDANFLPICITVLDGYGILPLENGTWYRTDIDDMTTIDPLAFAKAESNPDRNVRCASREGEAVFFGERSSEFWADTGTETIAFTRSQAIELGCLRGGGGSVSKVDRTLVWVAHDGTVRMLQGYSGNRISNHYIERLISQVDPTELRSTSWWSDGHTFYCLHSDSWSVVYDMKEGQWHERTSDEGSRWRVQIVARMGNDLIACDATTNDLYTMSHDIYTDGDSELVMTVQTPPIHAAPYRLQFDAAYVDIAPGVGLATGASQDVDPSMMVSWSDNGGLTWSNERQVSLGRQGDSLRRAVVRRLGVSSVNGRTFKFSISAAVAKAIMGLAVDANKMGI